MEDLHLEIISPEKVLYSGDIGLVELPGTSGRFTVLKNHAPIVSTLSEGTIRVIAKSGKESLFECSEGVFECLNNKASILLGAIVEK